MTNAHRASLISQSQYGLPNEICGILGGLDSRVLEIFPVANISSQPSNSSFMDPNELFKVLDLLDRRRWVILATFHSHPPGARADPSHSDLLSASYPGTIQVIVVPESAGHPESLRAFRI